MCGQFSKFPAEPDPEQPHTEPGSCLSHVVWFCVCVSVCLCAKRMNVSDCDAANPTERER